jgi:HD-GYP domain-containing protein (c-di-GMP phosphodiesterase class II)
MLTTITRIMKPTKPSMAPPLAAPGPLSQEVKALAIVLKEEFDASFRFYDAATGVPTIAPEQEEATATSAPWEREAAMEVAAGERPRVIHLPNGRYLIGFPLAQLGAAHLVAVGVVPGLAKTRPEVAQEQARLEKWSRSFHDRLVGARGIRDCQRSQAEQDRQSMIAWEAMMALDRLHRGAKIHKEPVRERQRVLRAAGELVGTQSLAWVPVHRDDDVVFEGERLLSPWDCGQLADILANQALWEETGYVIVNDTRETSWAARFSQVQNLLAIPIAERKLSGWVLAFNKRRTPARGPGSREARMPHPAGRDEPGSSAAGVLPFRRTDAALLLPFASLIGLHLRASRRYLHIKDLLVGLTRSLTAAIDAKDAYTYGHSERVARAAVELGRELGLQEDELSDIYLTGLLHDIGKIGIRDDVLTKRGPLTEEEFKHIQQHVVIGHRILNGLHAIEHLLPGVLYHHERYDGRGYPEGLKGEATPLLARILAVADSFDAMSTSRPYRTAMPFEKVDEVLRQGAGSQWDPLVIDAYVRSRDRLKAVRERGLGESLRNAIDGALRHGARTNEFASLEVSMVNEPRDIFKGLIR